MDVPTYSLAERDRRWALARELMQLRKSRPWSVTASTNASSWRRLRRMPP
jgi:hypothetical protein